MVINLKALRTAWLPGPTGTACVCARLCNALTLGLRVPHSPLWREGGVVARNRPRSNDLLPAKVLANYSPVGGNLRRAAIALQSLCAHWGAAQSIDFGARPPDDIGLCVRAFGAQCNQSILAPSLRSIASMCQACLPG